MNRKYIILIIVIVAVATLLGVVLWSIAHSNNDSLNETADTQSSLKASGTNEFSTIAKQDSASNSSKIDVIANNESAASDKKNSDMKSVEPVITYVAIDKGSLNANAYAPVVTTLGACEAKLFNFSRVLVDTLSVGTLPDATTTVCKEISFPVAGLSAGKYILQIEFSSDNYNGVSQEIEVTI